MPVEKATSYQLYSPNRLDPLSFVQENHGPTNMYYLGKTIDFLRALPPDILLAIDINEGVMPTIGICTLGLAEMGID